jgi:hypothetical protein
MRQLGQAEMVAWMRETLLPGGKGYRRLSVLVHPGAEAGAASGDAAAEWPLPAGACAIESVDAFRAGLLVSRVEPRAVPPVEAGH